MKEIWKDVKGWESIYQISNIGRFKTLNYRGTGKEKIISGWLDTDGYIKVILSKKGRKRITKSLHRLVYETFVGEIPQGMQVNHINEIKTDNRLENLNLMTPKENINWGTANERRSKKLKNGVLSKAVLQLNKDTNEVIAQFPSAMEVQRQLHFRQGRISACCRGERITAYNFKWSYL